MKISKIYEFLLKSDIFQNFHLLQLIFNINVVFVNFFEPFLFFFIFGKNVDISEKFHQHVLVIVPECCIWFQVLGVFTGFFFNILQLRLFLFIKLFVQIQLNLLILKHPGQLFNVNSRFSCVMQHQSPFDFIYDARDVFWWLVAIHETAFQLSGVHLGFV